MKNKPETQHVLALLFVAFISVFAVLFWAIPDKTFSEQENRYLQEFPDFSFEALFEQGWTKDFETYMTDQFPGRDSWVGLKSLSEYTLGKRENNGVYFGKDGSLLQDYQGGANLEKNAEYVQRFHDLVKVPVFFGLIPDSIWIKQAQLPAFSLEHNQQDALQAVENMLTFPTIPIAQTLQQHAAEEMLYYKTDHHWTMQGAYYGYTAIMEALGQAPLPEQAFQKRMLSSNFSGTLQAKSGAWWISPDILEGWQPLSAPNPQIQIYDGDTLLLTLESYFSYPRLDTRDQYSVYLDGNHSKVIIHTGNEDGKNLLLIKDSFGHALAPLLSAHYSQIHMVDLRYYKTDYINYILQHDIDEVLILYSVNTFSQDSNLVFLTAGY